MGGARMRLRHVIARGVFGQTPREQCAMRWTRTHLAKDHKRVGDCYRTETLSSRSCERDGRQLHLPWKRMSMSCDLGELTGTCTRYRGWVQQAWTEEEARGETVI